MDLKLLEAKDCTCDKCKYYCKRPGWFTPEQAEIVMNKGYSNRLMLDYWDTRGDRVYILCPANPGYESKEAPELNFLDIIFQVFVNTKFDLRSGCTFYTEDELCEIHSIKPLECKAASHNETLIEDREIFKDMWNTDKGREIIERWKKKVSYTECIGL